MADAGESGSPKSECFLGERKHSEALSFLSKAKKRLAELRADEAQWSKLREVNNEQTILGTARGHNITLCYKQKFQARNKLFSFGGG